MYVESKINPFVFVFLFGIFFFPSSSENCFYLKKIPPKRNRRNTVSVTVGYEQRRIRKLRITITFPLWNYQTFSVFQTALNWTDKGRYLFSLSSLSSPSFYSNIAKSTFPSIGCRCLAASSYRSRAWPTNQIYVHNVGHKVERSSSIKYLRVYLFRFRSWSCCPQSEFRSVIRFLREGWEGILFIRRGAKIRIDPWTPPWYTAIEVEGEEGRRGRRVSE